MSSTQETTPEPTPEHAPHPTPDPAYEPSLHGTMSISTTSAEGLDSEPVPVFTIDLAKDPRERYHEVVESLGPRMQVLIDLYNHLMTEIYPFKPVRGIAKGLSRLLLRRVYDKEENEEIKGIAAASGVPLHILAALNNFLDLFLGCTSGTAPISPPETAEETGDETSTDRPTLVHFRTLDWCMKELRDLLVVLEFVNSSSDTPTKVIATSITYAGFVGSLTAVREGLSISLNQRGRHNSPMDSLRRHQLRVLAGWRRSIGSIVRQFVLQYPERAQDQRQSETPNGEQESWFVEQARSLLHIKSPPCYFILCDGQEGVVIVKDFATGTIRSTRGFMTQTNHNPEDHVTITSLIRNAIRGVRQEVGISSFEAEGWLEESADRRQCLQDRWNRFVQGPGSEMNIPGIPELRLRRWICTYPVSNNWTHFTSILDPVTGKIRWLLRWPADDSE